VKAHYCPRHRWPSPRSRRRAAQQGHRQPRQPWRTGTKPLHRSHQWPADHHSRRDQHRRHGKGNPSAAFLLDGIYIARPQEADVSFLDINHIEVLKGPQGTLYGRNTTAGVINVITNKPQFGKLSAGLNLGYGNYNAINADGFVNAQATDWAAFRLSVNYDSRDTYIKPAANDPYFNKNFRTNISVRLQGLFKLGENGDAAARRLFQAERVT
jgi:outer membrane receptor protein involved in Fe transport